MIRQKQNLLATIWQQLPGDIGLALRLWVKVDMSIPFCG
jgi:hypothetical protein